MDKETMRAWAAGVFTLAVAISAKPPAYSGEFQLQKDGQPVLLAMGRRDRERTDEGTTTTDQEGATQRGTTGTETDTNTGTTGSGAGTQGTTPTDDSPSGTGTGSSPDTGTDGTTGTGGGAGGGGR